ncbi:hypothetical protein [Streptomyces sp. NPDC002550]
MYDFDTNSSTVGCLDMSGEQFTEPFMIDTIERRLRERPRPLAMAGEWTEICDLLSDQPSLPVAGMIFHTGRCGSTLIANALSALPQFMVLKESPFLSATASKALSGEVADTDSEQLVRALQRSCLPPTTGEQKHQIWKFASWNVLAEPLWAMSFPCTAQAFLWRPCVEVMASEIAAPPLWANGKGRVNHDMFAPGRRLMREAGLTNLPTPQAISLAAWLTTAAKGIELGERDAFVLPYDRIRADLATSLGALTRHFGATLTDAEIERATQVGQYYSKDPTGKKPFQTEIPARTMDSSVEVRIQDLASELEDNLRKLSDASVGTP